MVEVKGKCPTINLCNHFILFCSNVLKQRRIEQEKLSEKSSDKAVVSSLEQQNLDAVVRKLAVVRETRTNSIKMVATNEPKAKHKTWKPVRYSSRGSFSCSDRA